MPVEEAAWLTPDGHVRALALHAKGRHVTVTIPSVRVYGVLVVGKHGLDTPRSQLLAARARLARATLASGGKWEKLAPRATRTRNLIEAAANHPNNAADARAAADAATTLLPAAQQQSDEAYQEGLRRCVALGNAIRAFDFGATDAKPPWQCVQASSVFDPDAGFGWLPANQQTDPTPEETYYAMAHDHGANYRGSQPVAGGLLFWPYQQPIPEPLRHNLGAGAPCMFRVNLPAGRYRIRVITTNPSWTNRNFLVSGMVRVNGTVRLLDAPHDRGAIVAREFVVNTRVNRLDFTFGGPTGWAVAALSISPADNAESDAQVTGGLRTWRVSPRYDNPDWYPITQVQTPLEQDMNDLPARQWTQVQAPEHGLPVIDLGTNREASVGDVVYAATTIQSAAPRTTLLHCGASSQAQIWLNGAPVGYIPNEKGLRRDELACPVRLEQGTNQLVIKLQRFWERRWMFYVSSAASAD